MHDAVRLAAKHRLLVGIHESHRPTGVFAEGDWANGVENSRDLDRPKGGSLNSLDTSITPGGEGVEVVVSEAGISIGGDFTAMGIKPPVRIAGAVMEMDLVYYNRNATQHRNVDRFTSAPGAEREAERIQLLFQTRSG